jgi:hypothetical protein
MILFYMVLAQPTLDAYGECLRRCLICATYVLLISNLGVAGELVENRTCYQPPVTFAVVATCLSLSEARLTYQFIVWVVYITNREAAQQEALRAGYIDFNDADGVIADMMWPRNPHRNIVHNQVAPRLTAFQLKRLPSRKIAFGDALLDGVISSDDGLGQAYQAPAVRSKKKSKASNRKRKRRLKTKKPRTSTQQVSIPKKPKISFPRRRCGICLAYFAVADLVTDLPGCTHVFHKEELQMWLKTKATCPLCRSVVVV